MLEVSRSGYYAWLHHEPGERENANTELVKQIQQVFEESKETYGSIRITDELKAQGIACSKNRIARLMRLWDLKASSPKRFVVTTDSNHALTVAENVLDRDFVVEAPNRVWTSDISYVWTSEGWLYLAVILALFSRRIVGWSMGTTLERSLVLNAWEMAKQNRQPQSGLLFHSDRGSQYASNDCKAVLKEAEATQSMSRKGNCWDNAPSESFFATIKRELIYRHRYATQSEARLSIFAWIEGWYNRKRRHSTLGYLSPEAFERQYQEQQAQQQTGAMAA